MIEVRMPKNEFDFDDPMELNVVSLACEEDTTGAMAECFIEEFLRLGYNAKQFLALFRNPHYVGMHLVVQHRGEAFVRHKIAEVFSRWGKAVTWPDASATPVAQTSSLLDRRLPVGNAPERPAASPSASASGLETRDAASPDSCATTATDPMGMPVPTLNP